MSRRAFGPGRARGVACALGGVVALSTDSYFTRLADTDGADIVFWIGVLAALVLLGFVAVRPGPGPVARLRRRDGRGALLVAAGFQASATVCFVYAVNNTSVANVLVIVAAAPLAAAVAGWAVLGERPSARLWTAIGGSVAGIGVVVSGSIGSTAGEERLLGDLLAVGAVASFALGTVVLRRHPDMSRTMVVGLAGVGMAAATVAPATLTGHDWQTWVAFVGMGAVFGPLARVLLALASRDLEAAELGLFAPVETVLGSVWAWLAFAEVPTVRAVAGGALVLAALAWGIWPTTAPAVPTPPRGELAADGLSPRGRRRARARDDGSRR